MARCHGWSKNFNKIIDFSVLKFLSTFLYNQLSGYGGCLYFTILFIIMNEVFLKLCFGLIFTNSVKVLRFGNLLYSHDIRNLVSANIKSIVH